MKQSLLIPLAFFSLLYVVQAFPMARSQSLDLARVTADAAYEKTLNLEKLKEEAQKCTEAKTIPAVYSKILELDNVHWASICKYSIENNSSGTVRNKLRALAALLLPRLDTISEICVIEFLELFEKFPKERLREDQNQNIVTILSQLKSKLYFSKITSILNGSRTSWLTLFSQDFDHLAKQDQQEFLKITASLLCPKISELNENDLIFLSLFQEKTLSAFGLKSKLENNFILVFKTLEEIKKRTSRPPINPSRQPSKSSENDSDEDLEFSDDWDNASSSSQSSYSAKSSGSVQTASSTSSSAGSKTVAKPAAASSSTTAAPSSGTAKASAKPSARIAEPGKANSSEAKAAAKPAAASSSTTAASSSGTAKAPATSSAATAESDKTAKVGNSKVDAKTLVAPSITTKEKAKEVYKQAKAFMHEGNFENAQILFAALFKQTVYEHGQWRAEKKLAHMDSIAVIAESLKQGNYIDAAEELHTFLTEKLKRAERLLLFEKYDHARLLFKELAKQNVYVKVRETAQKRLKDLQEIDEVIRSFADGERARLKYQKYHDPNDYEKAQQHFRLIAQQDTCKCLKSMANVLLGDLCYQNGDIAAAQAYYEKAAAMKINKPAFDSSFEKNKTHAVIYGALPGTSFFYNEAAFLYTSERLAHIYYYHTKNVDKALEVINQVDITNIYKRVVLEPICFEISTVGYCYRFMVTNNTLIRIGNLAGQCYWRKAVKILDGTKETLQQHKELAESAANHLIEILKFGTFNGKILLDIDKKLISETLLNLDIIASDAFEGSDTYKRYTKIDYELN